MKTAKSKSKKPVDSKAQFRRSKEWTTFRQRMKKKQKYDYVTGSPLAKGFNLHHLREDPKLYSDISDDSMFVCLNNMSHSCLHFLWGDETRRYDWKQRLQRLRELCELMDELNKAN